jgi:hypothetical protein
MSKSKKATLPPRAKKQPKQLPPKSNLRPLDVLVKDIKTELQEITKLNREIDRHQTAVLELVEASTPHERAIAAALIEVKAHKPPGGFQKWVAKNLPGLSLRTYQRYIRREKLEKRHGVVYSSNKECERQNKKPRRPKAKPAPIEASAVVTVEPEDAPPDEEAARAEAPPAPEPEVQKEEPAQDEAAEPEPESSVPELQAEPPAPPAPGQLNLVGYSDDALTEALAALGNKRIWKIAAAACKLIDQRRFQKAEAA